MWIWLPCCKIWRQSRKAYDLKRKICDQNIHQQLRIRGRQDQQRLWPSRANTHVRPRQARLNKCHPLLDLWKKTKYETTVSSQAKTKVQHTNLVTSSSKSSPAKQTKIPVVFHNLTGYDNHLLVQQIHTTKRNLTWVAKNAGKYISFSHGQLIFLDSFQFMVPSLEKLVDATVKSDLKLTRKEFGKHTETILRKSVYPAKYIDNLEILMWPSYHRLKHFTAAFLMKASAKKTMTMLRKFEKNLTAKPSVISTTSISRQTSFCSLMYFKPLVKRVWDRTNLNLLTITPSPAYDGIPSSNTQA